MVVSGIVYVFMRFVVHDWLSWLTELINNGGLHWDIDNYRQLKDLSDFAGNWLEGVYMGQDYACEIISLSDHPFKSSKIQMLHICLSLDEEVHQVSCENLSSL